MNNNQEKITMLEKIKEYLLKRIDKGVKKRKMIYDIKYKQNKTKI